MNAEPYDTEDVLQRLLAEYPSILAGEQVSAGNPRRWILVAREASVRSTDGGSGRWAIDHLFLDQDGIPTIIEVKRSTDTRIRREVVGQMLNYAANAVVYWPAEHLRNQFELRCESDGHEPGERIIEALGRDDEVVFWQSVKTNLLAGNIRMIFVADEIPAELRRVVEFLNEQMNPAEVLALEVKQYVGQGLQVLVPKVIGKTERATPEGCHRRSSRSAWTDLDQSSVHQTINEIWNDEAAAVAKLIAEWAYKKQLSVRRREGKYSGIYSCSVSGRSRMLLFSFKTEAVLTLEMLGTLKPAYLPFDTDEAHLELIDRLNEIPGIDISRDSVRGFPSVDRTLLYDPTNLSQFLSAFEWVLDDLSKHARAQAT